MLLLLVLLVPFLEQRKTKQIRVILLLLLLVFGGASIDVLLTEDIHPFRDIRAVVLLSLLDLASKGEVCMVAYSCLTYTKKKKGQGNH